MGRRALRLKLRRDDTAQIAIVDDGARVRGQALHRHMTFDPVRSQQGAAEHRHGCGAHTAAQRQHCGSGLHQLRREG